MASVYLIRDIYGMETDAEDWPVGLPSVERDALMEIVRETITACAPLLTYELYQRVSASAETDVRCVVFNKGALLDWRYACVVRAARATGAEQRWHPT